MDIFFLNLIVHKQNRYQFMSLCIYGISGSRFNESGILKLENYSDQFSPVHEQFVQTRTVNRFNRLIKKKRKKKIRIKSTIHLRIEVDCSSTFDSLNVGFASL